MLTGMIKPTAGDAVIYGHTLLKEIGHVRQNLGLCQQFDVLFDELTVKQHLRLVCELKHVLPGTVEAEISKVIEEVMLFEHQDKPAKALSGGMKRKLSLAMALIGQPQVLILDEPTSGLDLDSRHKIWKLIRQI